MSVKLESTGWGELYTESRSPNPFLTRFFKIRPGNIYYGNKIAIDIQRFGEDVAIAVKRCTGPNLNDMDIFTTKEFEPPSYGEAFPLDVCDLISRMAGVDPYTSAGMQYQALLVAKMIQGFVLIDEKIQRAVELQASQVLQTGTLNLTNKTGDTVYTLDFKPKATHFPTTGTSWSAVGANPLADLEALAKIIRADGKVDPNMILMGSVALDNFLRNAEVKDRMDNRRFEIGEVRPEFRDSGATYYGSVWVGTYRMEIWAYPDTYTDPQSGLPVEYIGADKVVMLSDRTRLDMASAIVPLPLGPDPRVANLLPGRTFSRAGGFDVTPNVYATENGKNIMGELESRPLLIPVQIDGFGCLDTEI